MLNIYVGPYIDLGTKLQEMSFVAFLSPSGVTYNIAKNRYDGNNGQFPPEIIKAYVLLVLKGV